MTSSATSPRSLTFVTLDETFQLVLKDGEPHAIHKNGDIFGQNAPASLKNYANLVRHSPDGCGVLKAKVLVTGTCNQRCYYCSVAADWDKRGLSTDDLCEPPPRQPPPVRSCTKFLHFRLILSLL